MQTNDEYKALVPLRAPGTMVFGFQPGDGVPAATVEAWELTVGSDVMPRDTGVVARPEKDDERPAWEAYAIGQGLPVDEARAASLADLRKTPDPDPEVAPEPLADPNAAPVRPEPDAKKAEWVAYVKATGADVNWADDPKTTKAELQDYSPQRDVVPGTAPTVTPPVGDTIAETLTDQQAARS